MTGRLYTTDEAADLLGVGPDLISKWKLRRRVTPAGVIAGRGRGGMVPLYDLEHLRPLVDEYRQRVARRADNADSTE